MYLADEQSSPAPIALKVLSPLLVDDAAVLQRFERAAGWTRRLCHPGICQIFEVHTEAGWTFLSMQHVEGETLHHLLEARGPLAPEETLEVLRGLALPLDAAHAQGIIHGDLKPGNIMVATSWRITLLDFGVAATDNVTQIAGVGRTLASLRFIAPEMWQGEPASPRTDIYACLTGHPPNDDLEDGMRALAATTAAATAAGVQKSRRTVDAVVRRCMAKDPARRFTSAGEVHRAFEEAVAADRARHVAEALAQMHEAMLDGDESPKNPLPMGRRILKAAWLGMATAHVIGGAFVVWRVLANGNLGLPWDTEVSATTSRHGAFKDVPAQGEDMCLLPGAAGMAAVPQAPAHTTDAAVNHPNDAAAAGAGRAVDVLP